MGSKRGGSETDKGKREKLGAVFFSAVLRAAAVRSGPAHTPSGVKHPEDSRSKSFFSQGRKLAKPAWRLSQDCFWNLLSKTFVENFCRIRRNNCVRRQKLDRKS